MIATSSRGWGWQLGLVSCLAIGGAFAASGDYVLAQITPDATLGAESSVVTPTNIDGLPTERIDGGATRGANLFHSFEQFSVPTRRAAFFNNTPDIQNIISRVTSGSISNIDGLIRANGAANLFLLNPNGIIFGRDASLNIGGSILASTASSLNFADGTNFSATAPPTTPLLTVSVPIGLQFGGTAGSIINRSRVSNSSGQPVGLQVSPGKALALVGGDVSLNRGILQTIGGEVELGGLAGAGTVGLNVDGNDLNLSFPDGVARADVSLTNGAEVNVSASGGGSIALTARNINVLGGSRLLAGIASGLGSADIHAGNITLNATDATTVGQSSRIQNTIAFEATGTGGDISITTGSLSVTDGAQLNANTFGHGNAGSVNIHAGSTVSFDGVNRRNRASSAARSNVESGGQGNGGSVNITAESLSVTNGAEVGASTFDRGNAGSVNIHARHTVSFDGVGGNRYPSAARSRVYAGAEGNGGSINIRTGSLSVTNGAAVTTSTFGRGNAGSVNIHAHHTVSFDDITPNGRPSSGAFSRVYAGAEGNGGSINIRTGLLSVTDGAEVSTNSEGSSEAGNIEVTARSIRLSNDALLSSETKAGQGNIILRSQDLVLRRGSNITTDATGTATGGNITIDTGVLAALENSDITADAQDASGGRVRINAQGLFGTEFRNQQTSLSDITASSDLGPQFSGTVEINTPDVDPRQGLATLPAELVEASRLIATGCTTVGENEFIVTGRGGLPPNPSDTLSSETVWTDLRTFTEQTEARPSSEETTRPTNPTTEQIVEAQGWVINNRGEVVLTAHAPNVTLNVPWMTPATCHSSTSHQRRKLTGSLRQLAY